MNEQNRTKQKSLKEVSWPNCNVVAKSLVEAENIFFNVRKRRIKVKGGGPARFWR